MIFNRSGSFPYVPPPIVEIVSWEEGTDAQIAAMVAADRSGTINLQDYWSVGDTRSVSLSAMEATGVGETHAAQTVNLVLMDSTCRGFTWTETPSSGVTVPRFIVGMKDSLKENGYMNAEGTNAGGWRDCARRAWCNSIFYNALPTDLKPIFKYFSWSQGQGGTDTGVNTTSDIFALAVDKTIFGSSSNAVEAESALYAQWTWYSTASNRIKKVNGSNSQWWEASALKNNTNAFLNVSNAGAATSGNNAIRTRGISPFGCV